MTTAKALHRIIRSGGVECPLLYFESNFVFFKTFGKNSFHCVTKLFVLLFTILKDRLIFGSIYRNILHTRVCI